MFPFRYGRRNSCGHTTPGFVTVVCFQAIIQIRDLWFVYWFVDANIAQFVTVRGLYSVCKVFVGQALGLLVPVGWALLLYTSGLSTQCSAGGLTRLTRWETSS